VEVEDQRQRSRPERQLGSKPVKVVITRAKALRYWAASRARHFVRRVRRPWNPGVRQLEPDLLTRSPITDRLFARLDESDRAAIERSLAEPLRRVLEQADPTDRKRATLAFGIHCEVPGVAAKTGLVNAVPPEHLHAMARGPFAAGGDFYYADLVADALESAGVHFDSAARALDFGCSTGRVVRPLAAAYPHIDWHGCDPLADSIAWARSNLQSITFKTSPPRPPLPYDAESFDFAFAISIWSHFSKAVAGPWLDELRRVLKPDGLMLLTTHGWHSITHALQVDERSPEQLTAICQALFEEGYWYAPEFGSDGDHGLVDPDWGNAFLTAEWLLAQACPSWSVRLFAPGRVEADQDLYVLQTTGR
jgi:SAM-dependent methyltransferase